MNTDDLKKNVRAARSVLTKRTIIKKRERRPLSSEERGRRSVSFVKNIKIRVKRTLLNKEPGCRALLL